MFWLACGISPSRDRRGHVHTRTALSPSENQQLNAYHCILGSKTYTKEPEHPNKANSCLVVPNRPLMASTYPYWTGYAPAGLGFKSIYGNGSLIHTFLVLFPTYRCHRVGISSTLWYRLRTYTVDDRHTAWLCTMRNA